MAFPFDYAAAPVPVRPDIVQAHDRAWERLRRAGNWWTGSERIEIAAAVRSAPGCALCRERKAAVSPFSVEGEHDAESETPTPLALDTVHRIVTDAGRLSQSWLEKCAANGLSDGHYVELLGIVVAILSIDEFHRALGLPLAPLPTPLPGTPTRKRPAGLESGIAWVPMLPYNAATKGPDADIYAGMPQAPNVIAAMSLVPDAVRQLNELSDAYYLPKQKLMNPVAGGEGLDRAQIELIAGRVSALNECFY